LDLQLFRRKASATSLNLRMEMFLLEYSATLRQANHYGSVVFKRKTCGSMIITQYSSIKVKSDNKVQCFPHPVSCISLCCQNKNIKVSIYVHIRGKLKEKNKFRLVDIGYRNNEKQTKKNKSYYIWGIIIRQVMMLLATNNNFSQSITICRLQSGLEL
jgi:hypothetical protein